MAIYYYRLQPLWKTELSLGFIKNFKYFASQINSIPIQWTVNHGVGGQDQHQKKPHKNPPQTEWYPEIKWQIHHRIFSEKTQTFFPPVSFLSQKKNTVVSNFCHDLWLQNNARVTYYFPHYVSQYSIMHKFSFSSYLQANAIIPFKRGLTCLQGFSQIILNFSTLSQKKELRIL